MSAILRAHICLLFLSYTYRFHLTLLISRTQALASSLCMNIYVVGLNQLFDIEIDKVIFHESTSYCPALLFVLSRTTYACFEGQQANSPIGFWRVFSDNWSIISWGILGHGMLLAQHRN